MKRGPQHGVPLTRRIRVGLAAKLAVSLVASTAAFFALFGYFNLKAQNRHSKELVMQAADRISEVILRSTHYLMLHNDREMLLQVINAIGSEPGIRRIRIFNKDGRISFSTAAKEVGSVVGKRAEQCYPCHSQQPALARLDRTDRARIFTAGHERLLGVIRPIENSESCSNATCHGTPSPHPANVRVLGVIDSNLSLASVDVQSAQYQSHLLWMSVAALVLVSCISVAFIWVVVYRPVKELITGTRRVAAGELDYRLPVHSDDELGDLATSFNKMTAEVAGVQAEIEERVRIKTAELERAHKGLLRSEKLASIGKLAATVAHEINNPLFGILTYARLILREVEKSDLPVKVDLAEQLRTIERESRRCGDIVKNLLTFARQAPSHRDANEIGTIIERTVTLVRHKLDLQGIQLDIQVADAPPVFCDAGQIQQVFLILLVNAAEAMPGGGNLTLTTEVDASGEAVRVRVRDTGSGIRADVLPQIFDPFFTTKEDQQRTGLGLAVARSIVEQHGGEIAVVHSVPGEGTEFQVSLPVAVLAAAGVTGCSQPI